MNKTYNNLLLGVSYYFNTFNVMKYIDKLLYRLLEIAWSRQKYFRPTQATHALQRRMTKLIKFFSFIL